MRFGPFIEYSMRNIFLEKSYTKCGEVTSSRPFSGKLKLRISRDQYSKVFIQFVFIVSQVEGYQNILKLSCISLAFTPY